jgi:hypothetical protein
LKTVTSIKYVRKNACMHAFLWTVVAFCYYHYYNDYYIYTLLILQSFFLVGKKATLDLTMAQKIKAHTEGKYERDQIMSSTSGFALLHLALLAKLGRIQPYC